MKRLRRSLLLLLPLLVALVVSGALYMGTKSVDEQKHAAVLRAIERERHLDALLKREVLAARFGLLTQYDPIEEAISESETTRASIVNLTKTPGAGSPDLKSALDSFAEISTRRSDDVQNFKSNNSILKNSLHYLPVAADELNGKLTEQGAEDLKRDVNAVVQATLVYNIIGGDDRRSAEKAKLAALEARLPKAPEAVRSDLELLLAHARTVDTQSTIVDPLLQHILDDDVETSINGVEQAYQRAHGLALAKAARYRFALYAWSVVLLLGIVIAVMKLVGLYGNLERLVQERTRELKKALDALWGEMHLAKKIQTALVPTNATLEACEIAMAMKPADQVGGDYYDVLRVGGVDWVLIGDVSGHGVPAGLVMMMCQTAVRAVLERDPHLEPGELLALVNRALTQNIKRLGEDKYMTLQAFRRDKDGGFTHAGLHQDLFVYRASTGKVEDHKSNGMWLGIIDDLAGMFRTERLTLDEGDVLLLFTDGITEAKRDGKMLDNDGLAKLLETHGALSPSEIVDRILSELSSYETDDDVSIVVIKEGRSSREHEKADARSEEVSAKVA